MSDSMRFRPERERLIEELAEHLGFNGKDGTYYYCLTRVKSAFAVGTVSIDDFQEINTAFLEDFADFILGREKSEIERLTRERDEARAAAFEEGKNKAADVLRQYREIPNVGTLGGGKADAITVKAMNAMDAGLAEVESLIRSLPSEPSRTPDAKLLCIEAREIVRRSKGLKMATRGNPDKFGLILLCDEGGVVLLDGEGSFKAIGDNYDDECKEWIIRDRTPEEGEVR